MTRQDRELPPLSAQALRLIADAGCSDDGLVPAAEQQLAARVRATLLIPPSVGSGPSAGPAVSAPSPSAGPPPGGLPDAAATTLSAAKASVGAAGAGSAVAAGASKALATVKLSLLLLGGVGAAASAGWLAHRAVSEERVVVTPTATDRTRPANEPAPPGIDQPETRDTGSRQQPEQAAPAAVVDGASRGQQRRPGVRRSRAAKRSSSATARRPAERKTSDDRSAETTAAVIAPAAGESWGAGSGPALGSIDAPEADSLRAEHVLLRAARRALRRGDVGQAKRLLDSHRERFPSGKLAEERDAISVSVLWRMGRHTAARRAAERFRRRHPGSILQSSIDAVVSQTPCRLPVERR